MAAPAALPAPPTGYSSGEDTPAEPLSLHAVQGSTHAPPLGYYAPQGTPCADGTPSEVLRLQAVQQQHSEMAYFGAPPLGDQPLPLSAVQQLQGDRSGVVLADGTVAQYQADPPSAGAVYVRNAQGHVVAVPPPECVGSPD